MDATHERTPGRRRISSVSLCFFSRYCDCDRSVVFLVLFFFVACCFLQSFKRYQHYFSLIDSALGKEKINLRSFLIPQ